MINRAFGIGVLSLFASTSSFAAKRPLGVSDAIQTTRAMVDEGLNSVFPSPDGTRYVVLLIRGDVARDGIFAEIVSGRLDSIEAATPHPVASLFSNGLGASEGLSSAGGVTELSMSGKNWPIWIDNRHIALRWPDENGKSQVVSVDVNTGDVRYLTHHPEDVLRFEFAPDGSLIYDGRIGFSRERSEELMHDGFTVDAGSSLPAVLGGIVDSTTGGNFGAFERFIRVYNGESARKITSRGKSINYYGAIQGTTSRLGASRFSPDGKLAIVDGSPAAIPEEWLRYSDPLIHSMIAEYLRSFRADLTNDIQQLFVLDLKRAEARPLWNAPSAGWETPWLEALAWSPDGHSVLFGPTVVPTDGADEESLAGRAIVEVDVATARYSKIPGSYNGISVLRWLDNALIEIVLADGAAKYFEKHDGLWRKITAQMPKSKIKQENAINDSRVSVSIKQAFDNPPRLYAMERSSGRAKMVRDLNPGLQTDFSLGRVEFIKWKDPEGVERKARLYHPVPGTSNAPYPIVVQTSGYAGEDEFSLYGPGNGAGLGPAELSANVAQLLANRGIAVLQIGIGVVRSGDDSASSAQRWASGVQTALQFLGSKGVVDGKRVGLMGFSIMGRYVEHSLTFSQYPYAAALIIDHADVNYVQAAAYEWPAWQADWHGAPPFGPGLQKWMQTSPAFNAQQIRTPIQYCVTDTYAGLGTLLWPWEMVSRLRALKKPVELFVMPDILHGSHNPQNPRQLSALHTRALDWWLFWLVGNEDRYPTKEIQYASWRNLRQLYDASIHDRAM